MCFLLDVCFRWFPLRQPQVKTHGQRLRPAKSTAHFSRVKMGFVTLTASPTAQMLGKEVRHWLSTSMCSRGPHLITPSFAKAVSGRTRRRTKNNDQGATPFPNKPSPKCYRRHLWLVDVISSDDIKNPLIDLVRLYYGCCHSTPDGATTCGIILTTATCIPRFWSCSTISEPMKLAPATCTWPSLVDSYSALLLIHWTMASIYSRLREAERLGLLIPLMSGWKHIFVNRIAADKRRRKREQTILVSWIVSHKSASNTTQQSTTRNNKPY